MEDMKEQPPKEVDPPQEESTTETEELNDQNMDIEVLKLTCDFIQATDHFQKLLLLNLQGKLWTLFQSLSQ